MYKNLGYFSLIGLLRLHCQLGDYYQALQSVDNVQLSKKVYRGREGGRDERGRGGEEGEEKERGGGGEGRRGGGGGGGGGREEEEEREGGKRKRRRRGKEGGGEKGGGKEDKEGVGCYMSMEVATYLLPHRCLPGGREGGRREGEGGREGGEREGAWQ